MGVCFKTNVVLGKGVQASVTKRDKRVGGGCESKSRVTHFTDSPECQRKPFTGFLRRSKYASNIAFTKEKRSVDNECRPVCSGCSAIKGLSENVAIFVLCNQY